LYQKGSGFGVQGSEWEVTSASRCRRLSLPPGFLVLMTIQAARRIARLLAGADLKVVFAESCTGGLVSGALSKIPGISNHHCGGVVVYRNETKMAWLEIPATILAKPGPVSEEVARLMAERVLKKTPEADIAVSVTGHLGPHAPAALDGVVFSAAARRGKATKTRKWRCSRDKSRVRRQRWVVEQVLDFLGDQLESQEPQLKLPGQPS
jgi:nicotinamide-nucleotide amidase